MSSKPIHSHDALTREEIRTYRSSSDQKLKNSIERKAANSAFESDALEGWTESALPADAMRKLDRKFSGSWNVYLTILALGIVPLILLITFFILPDDSPKVTIDQPADLSTKIEKTDLVIPEPIEALSELPAKEQIQIKQVIKDFQEQQQEPKPTQVNPDPIDQLSTYPVDQTPAPKPEKELLFGKELLLKDLKVLDYRSYRSKPAISTEQLVLTGTPANIGEKQNSAEEEFTWKTVDVPYIDYLEKTMELFSKGNNKKALTRFEEILKTYPDDVNALFYAGLCYYNLKDYSKATEYFSKCQLNKYANFNEEAQWYNARSFLAKGEKETAQQLLREIVGQKGFYAKQAEKLLKN